MHGKTLLYGSILTAWALATAVSASEHVAPIDLTISVGEGRTHLTAVEPGVVEWRLPDGLQQTVRIDLKSRGIDPASYDELRFDVMPLGSQVRLHTMIQGFPREREVSSWYLKFKTPVGVWTSGRYDLHLDDDGIFMDAARGKAPAGTLMLSLGRRIVGSPGEPTWRKARLRNMRLVRRLVTVDFDPAAVEIIDDAGQVGCAYTLRVTNRTKYAQTVDLDPDSAGGLKFFRVEAERQFKLRPGQERAVPVRVIIDRKQAMRLPPLYAEPIVPKVSIPGLADSDAIPLMSYRARPLWGVVPVFGLRPEMPAEMQARLAARTKAIPALATWREKFLKRAKLAGAHDWPIPTDILPGHTMGYRCRKCRIDLRPVDPTRFRRHTCPGCKTIIENDKRTDRAYVGRYYGILARHVRNAGLAYLLTGDEAHARAGTRILLALAAAHPDMPIAGARSTSGGTRLGCNSLLTTYVLPSLAEGYAFLGTSAGLDETKRARIRKFLIDEACAAARHSVEYSNQTAEHFRAYGTVGLVTGYWPLAAEAIHGEFGWHELVEYGYSEEGIGHEAGAYHRSLLMAMNHFAEFAAGRGVDLYTARFKRVFDGSLLLGELGISYESAYRAYRDPSYVPALVKQRKRPLEPLALHGVLGIPDSATIPVRSELMPATGYVLLRRGNAASYTELRINYIKRFDRLEHDRFTTFFYRNGRQLDGTAGRIIYSSPKSHWMSETAAHNTIVIDGASERDVAGRLLAFQRNGPVPVAVLATSPDAPFYEGVKQIRGVALLDDSFVVFDRVTCDRPRTIDRYQHGRGGATLKTRMTPLADPPVHLPQHSDFTRIEGGPAGKALRVDFGNGLKMRLVSDRDLDFYKAIGVAGWQASPAEVTFARARNVRAVTFLAVFRFGKKSLPPEGKIIHADEDRLEIGVANTRIVVDLRTGAASVAGGS